ncbi:MAG: hypothetical protein NT041_01290 [Candidatus Vogelbacteria bacterium]|nr:hypothetical protein [Candidatus Vogelbacteria bacterium]
MHYGFIIITLAWLWQYWQMRKGHRSLDQWFLRLYAVGLLIILLDTFRTSDWLTWANVAAMTVILLLIWKLRR